MPLQQRIQRASDGMGHICHLCVTSEGVECHVEPNTFKPSAFNIIKSIELRHGEYLRVCLGGCF